MNVQCVICRDVVDLRKAGNKGFKSSALSCGHVFHTDCINRWLDQSVSAAQGTCPKCRCVVKKKSALRVFIDLVPMENDQDDALKRVIEYLRGRLTAKTQLANMLTRVNRGLKERVLELEQKEVTAQENIEALKMTRINLNKKSKELEDTKDELEKLREKLRSLTGSITFTNSYLKDVDARLALLKPGPSTVTSEVFNTNKRKLVPSNSHLYKIPKVSSISSSAASLQGSQIGGARPKVLTIPESYEELGGLSRSDNPPKVALLKPGKIDSDRKTAFAVKPPWR